MRKIGWTNQIVFCKVKHFDRSCFGMGFKAWSQVLASSITKRGHIWSEPKPNSNADCETGSSVCRAIEEEKVRYLAVWEDENDQREAVLRMKTKATEAVPSAKMPLNYILVKYDRFVS